VEAGPATVWIGGGQPGPLTSGVALKVGIKGRRSLPPQ
jgi:beta-glucosidase